jgi:hypothetical protein
MNSDFEDVNRGSRLRTACSVDRVEILNIMDNTTDMRLGLHEPRGDMRTPLL